MSIISVQNISKSFRIYGSEWHRVLNWFGLSIRPKAQKDILKSISFEIGAGETVGIIGQNGAGKSTLLKILTGTMQPDRGTFHINGRIAALLELGMGFNPELPGRTNVLNTGGLMGYSQEEMEGVVDEIEAFAEIGSYFDQPLRTYSSGMQVRLAFAVATAFRPEILIVDEALSVGDSYFQHKSFNRIRQFSEEGTTLLLVSHDRSAIASLCNRAILINEGVVKKDGNPEEVLDLYNAVIAEKEGYVTEQIEDKSGKKRTVSGTGEATVKAICLKNEAGDYLETLKVGETVTLEIDVQAKQPLDELALGYLIKDRLGQPIFGTNSFHLGQVIEKVEAGANLRYRFKFAANFGVGNYSIAVALHKSAVHVTHNYEWRDLALTFTVINHGHDQFVGRCWMPPQLEIIK